MRIANTALPLTVTVFAAAALAAACGSEPKAAAPEPPSVAAAVARAGQVALPVQFEAGGVVRAPETAVVSARVLAPILEVRVRPGDHIRRGQVLLTLDARDLAAGAARAAAALDGAREAGDAARSEQQAADAALQLARATDERIRKLHASRAATAQELDEAVAGLHAAEARAAAARAHVNQAEAARNAAAAAKDAANVTASYASVTAPFDGLVTARSVDPGTVAAPGMPLMTVEAAGAFHLEAALDETRAASIRVGDAAAVRLDASSAAPAEWIPGRVIEVARLDPATHSFVVKVSFDAPAGVRSGLFGRARFTSGTRRALVVPAGAVVERGQLTFVYAVSPDGLARLRPVTAGAASDGQVEIVAGLAEGESVVVGPPPSIVDGARVTSGEAGRGATR